jgi:hypothetical protein
MRSILIFLSVCHASLKSSFNGDEFLLMSGSPSHSTTIEDGSPPTVAVVIPPPERASSFETISVSDESLRGSFLLRNENEIPLNAELHVSGCTRGQCTAAAVGLFLITAVAATMYLSIIHS